MSGQDDYFAVFGLFDDFPCFSASRWIHARRRLVQEDNLGVAQQRDRELELSLLSAWDWTSERRLLSCQIELLKSVVNHSVHVFNVLELAVENEVFSDGHLGEKNVVLRAEADEVRNILVVFEQVDFILGANVVSDGAAGRWLSQTS